MSNDHIANHTVLIEQEDDLIGQIDTCQYLLSAMWRVLRSSEETLHMQTVRDLLLALYNVERNIEDELLDIRLALLSFAATRKNSLPGETKH